MEVMHRCQDLRAIVSVEYIDNFGGGVGEGLGMVCGRRTCLIHAVRC